MTKKIDFKMPAAAPPVPNAVDDWVSGNTADQNLAPVKLARLTIDLPVDLHTRFKTECSKRRIKMVDEVRQMIEAWIQKHAEL